MADEVTRTIVDGMGGTGTALGAGVGGLFGSWFGNAWNGNGGFGGNNNTYLANQLSGIQSQAVANGIANREAVSGMSHIFQMLSIQTAEIQIKPLTMQMCKLLRIREIPV